MEINLLMLGIVVVVTVCNNMLLKNYHKETIRIEAIGNSALQGPNIYAEGTPPNENHVISFKSFNVENTRQLISYYIATFPLWRRIYHANQLQLSDRYLKYIFQRHMVMGKKLVKRRTLFYKAFLIISNVVILTVGVKAILY